MELTSEQRERLQKQFDFILEIDREKEIVRQTPIADASRHENDAEHAWHMAVMVMILSEYATEKIDPFRTMSMLLIHDLIEIYAGDTYAFDETAKKSQRERELLAADRLYQKLPEDQGRFLRQLWDEFEEQKTPEARFARAMDNLQPMMLNKATDGISWVEHGVRLSQVLHRNENTARGSEILWQYAQENWLKPSVEKGFLSDDVSGKTDGSPEDTPD